MTPLTLLSSKQSLLGFSPAPHLLPPPSPPLLLSPFPLILFPLPRSFPLFPFSPSSLQNSVNVYLPLSRFYESVKYCLFSGSLLDPLFVQSDTWYHLLSFSESSQTHHVQPSLPLFSVPCLREWHHLLRKPEMWELIHRSIPVPIHFYCYSLMYFHSIGLNSSWLFFFFFSKSFWLFYLFLILHRTSVLALHGSE